MVDPADAGAVRVSVSVFSLDAAQTCRGKGWPGDGSETAVLCLCRLEGLWEETGVQVGNKEMDRSRGGSVVGGSVKQEKVAR